MCLNLGKRVRSFIVAVETVCDQLVNILLGVGGEVSWQPSGPTGLPSTSLWAVYHKIAQRHCCVCPLMGKQNLAPRLLLTVSSWSLIPSLPYLTTA